MLRNGKILAGFGRTGLILLLALCIHKPVRGDEAADLINQFTDNPDYVRPFATLYGSLTNSGWYQSASVSKGIGFYVGIPMTITQIAGSDRDFSATYVNDGCEAYHQQNPSGTGCSDMTHYTTPTAFGRSRAPTLYRTDVGLSGNIIDSMAIPVNDGIPALSKLNWLPFGMPQVSASFWYTEVKFRYLAIPTIAGVSFNMPGFGIQHDLRSFLPPLPVPVHISLAGNFTWMNVGWKPENDSTIQGTLNLNAFSDFFGVLVGYTFHGWAEAFLETGWETATVHSGGHVIIHNDDGTDEDLHPDLSIDGRNGFRAALNVAIHFGYDAVLGQNLGADVGNQISILNYRFK